MPLTDPSRWRAHSRAAGCAWVLAGLALAALGALALLALLASSWGEGFAGPIEVLLLLVGLGLGVLGVGVGITGAEAVLSRRRPGP